MSWNNSGTKFGKLYVIAHQKWYDALFWEIGFPVYRLVAVYWYSFYVMNDMHHQTRDSTLNVVLYVINGKKFWKSFLCMVMPSILRYAEFNHTGLPEAIDLSNFSTAWKHAITIYYGKYKSIIQFSCAFQSFYACTCKLSIYGLASFERNSTTSLRGKINFRSKSFIGLVSYVHTKYEFLTYWRLIVDIWQDTQHLFFSRHVAIAI